MLNFTLMKQLACLVLLFCLGSHTLLRADNVSSITAQDPIVAFWTWFQQHQNRLRQFESDPGKYLQEIHTQVKKIGDGLTIELEPPQNGIINLTFSADGDQQLFPLVRSIVDKAPPIKGWHFIAFRQRADLSRAKSMQLKVGTLTLDPQSMKFFPVVTGDTLDIIIYVKGLTQANYADVAYHGLLLLDNLLGEYDCVMKVRSYDFHPMPAKKEELDTLQPLFDIASYVDRFHANRKPR